ncbi:MAG: serine hydrolase, partial [Gemmatimonadota bacterium]|nr:serine hydrolase [Gemmatimonadota bacterium]
DGRDWGTIVDRISGAGQPYWELRGNGGLGTTLGDMARWDAALNDRRMLTDSSRRKFMTGYVDEGPAGLSRYAYGWALMKTSRNTTLVSHNGGNGIFVAELLRFVDEGVTIFLASTNADMKATPAVRVVSHIMFGEPYELPPHRANVSATTVATLPGTYAMPNVDRIILRMDGGDLVADPAGQSAYALGKTGDTASSPRARALSAKSKIIVEALVKGDATLLVAALDGAPPLAEVQDQERGLHADRRARWGELRAIDVLGTVSDGIALVTTVRLTFERGVATNFYAWNASDKIMDVGAQPYKSIALTPVGDTEVVAALPGGGSLHLVQQGSDLVARAKARSVLLSRLP